MDNHSYQVGCKGRCVVCGLSRRAKYHLSQKVVNDGQPVNLKPNLPLKIKVSQYNLLNELMGIELVAEDPDDMKILERFAKGGIKINCVSYPGPKLSLSFGDLIKPELPPTPTPGSGKFFDELLDGFGKMMPAFACLNSRRPVDVHSEDYLQGKIDGIKEGIAFNWNLPSKVIRLSDNQELSFKH
jgi:hypothetical protein